MIYNDDEVKKKKKKKGISTKFLQFFFFEIWKYRPKVH